MRAITLISSLSSPSYVLISGADNDMIIRVIMVMVHTPKVGDLTMVMRMFTWLRIM